MNRKRFLKMAAALVLMLAVSGCGGSDVNNNTNGTLTLVATGTSNSPGITNLAAIATVGSTVSGAKLSGVAVNFTGRLYGKNSTGVVVTTQQLSARIPTDSTGTSEWDADFRNETYATTLEVTAIAGGLAKTVQIPLLAVP